MAGLDRALAPFTLKGFYLVTWGTAIGTNVWQSLVSHLLSSTHVCRSDWVNVGLCVRIRVLRRL